MKAGLLLLLLLPLPALADDGCLRSEPQSIYRKGNPALASHSFTPANSHEAHETIRLRNGASLRIEHGGCETFSTRFRFNVPSLQAGSVKPADAFHAAAAALRTLQQTGADTTFDLPLAAETLEKVRAPAYEVEYLIGPDEDNILQSRFIVLGAGKGLVDIVLFWPL